MLVRDPETGKAMHETDEQVAARLGRAAIAREQRTMRAQIGDKVWGALGAQTMAELLVQRENGAEAPAAAESAPAAGGLALTGMEIVMLPEGEPAAAALAPLQSA